MNYPVEPELIQGRRWPLFVVIIIGMAAAVYFNFHQPDHTGVLVGLVFIAIFFTLWFMGRKAGIWLDSDRIGYRSVFRKEYMNWNDIKRSFLKYQHHGKSGHLEWIVEDETGRQVKLPMVMYSRASYRKIAEIMRMKSPMANLDQRILNMSEGIFPWYIF